MTKTIKIIIGFLALVVIVLGGYIVSHSSSKNHDVKVKGIGEPSGFDNVNLTGSIRTGVAAGDTSVTTNGNGSATVGGNIVNSSAIATTTVATSQTLKSSDIIGFSAILMTPNVGSDTITLPASSTLSTWLANAGDTTSFVLFNSTTTAGVNLTVVAGTGTLVESASSTAVTVANHGSTIDVFRKPNSDLVFIINPAI